MMFGPQDPQEAYEAFHDLGMPPQDLDYDRWQMETQLGECPICHELGACGYDDEGLPMIHVQSRKDRDD
jgi:hypothetical protein